MILTKLGIAFLGVPKNWYMPSRNLLNMITLYLNMRCKNWLLTSWNLDVNMWMAFYNHGVGFCLSTCGWVSYFWTMSCGWQVQLLFVTHACPWHGTIEVNTMLKARDKFFLQLSSAISYHVISFRIISKDWKYTPETNMTMDKNNKLKMKFLFKDADLPSLSRLPFRHTYII